MKCLLGQSPKMPDVASWEPESTGQVGHWPRASPQCEEAGACESRSLSVHFNNRCSL